MLVAESQCRQNQDEQATQTYPEVVNAVARVQQNGLRGVLTGYLVDSLISTGRFEDARASLVLYPTESERFVALEAIAESQGRRGAAAAAREWIAREARPEYRSALYRRVNSGVLAAIETERSSLYLGKDVQQAPRASAQVSRKVTQAAREGDLPSRAACDPAFKLFCRMVQWIRAR